MPNVAADVTVTSLLSDVPGVVSSVFESMTANPILCVFLGMGVIGAGAALFARLKRTSR